METFPNFPFLTWKVELAGQTVTGGQSTSGQVQTSKTDGGGRWVFEATDAELYDRGQLTLWRKFEALLDGGATEVIVALCDRRQAPVQLVDGRPVFSSTTTPHSDQTLFSDYTGYYQPALAIDVEAASGAALRATELDITVNLAGPIIGGEHFSITHPTAGRRLYRIAKVVSDDGEGALTIKIRPPLREAIEAGDALDFDDPSCVMRLASSAIAPPVEGHMLAVASITFVESFDYAS